MNKTISLTISTVLAIGCFASVAAPANAATRLMSSSVEGFQYRCENHGGIFNLEGALASCETPSVPVACEYFDDRQAMCDWPGIERQIAVIQVIGTLPEGPSEAESDDGSSDGAIEQLGAGQDDDDADYMVPAI